MLSLRVRLAADTAWRWLTEVLEGDCKGLRPQTKISVIGRKRIISRFLASALAKPVNIQLKQKIMKSRLLQGPKIFFPPQAYEETILQKMTHKALQQTNAIHIPGTYKRYTECKGLHKTAFNKSIFN